MATAASIKTGSYALGAAVTGLLAGPLTARQLVLVVAIGQLLALVPLLGRRPENPLRVNFRGVPAYEPDPRWAVTGRYRAFGAPRDVTVGAAVEGLQHVYAAPGEIEFELDGQTLRLTAFGGKTPGSLTVLFTDATSGVTTYAASRVLHLDAPAADGAVTVDFNRAVNLPCAYTELATCPLPPAGNRLPVAVEAGEKIPYEKA